MTDVELTSRTKLEQALENLYLTFREYALRPHIEACEHCTDEADQQVLRSKPLRELSASDLSHFANDAINLFGNTYDFKHFLPRLFELLASDGDEWIDPHILLSKLRYADWHTWPISEQTVVAKYLEVFWLMLLSTFPARWDTDTCLCAIAQAAEDMTPFLRVWIEVDWLPARRHLTGFLHTQLSDANLLLKRKRLASPWWAERQPQMQQTVRWLLEPKTSQSLETYVLDHWNDPVADESAIAVDLLATLRNYLPK